MSATMATALVSATGAGGNRRARNGRNTSAVKRMPENPYKSPEAAIERPVVSISAKRFLRLGTRVMLSGIAALGLKVYWYGYDYQSWVRWNRPAYIYIAGVTLVYSGVLIIVVVAFYIAGKRIVRASRRMRDPATH
jgi:hypothetical protein